MFSIKDKFTFIHIPKTSGSSLTHMVSNQIETKSNNLKLHGMGWQKKYHFNKMHEDLNSVEKSDFENIENDIITIVRNPYSRMVSICEHLGKDWKTFLHRLPKMKKFFVGKWHYTQYDYIKNKYNLNVKIYKFEENPLEKICMDYNLKYEPIHRLKTNYKYDSFWDYYDSEKKQIVFELCKKDFEYFDYKEN